MYLLLPKSYWNQGHTWLQIVKRESPRSGRWRRSRWSRPRHSWSSRSQNATSLSSTGRGSFRNSVTWCILIWMTKFSTEILNMVIWSLIKHPKDQRKKEEHDNMRVALRMPVCWNKKKNYCWSTFSIYYLGSSVTWLVDAYRFTFTCWSCDHCGSVEFVSACVCGCVHLHYVCTQLGPEKWPLLLFRLIRSDL